MFCCRNVALALFMNSHLLTSSGNSTLIGRGFSFGVGFFGCSRMALIGCLWSRKLPFMKHSSFINALSCSMADILSTSTTPYKMALFFLTSCCLVSSCCFIIAFALLLISCVFFMLSLLCFRVSAYDFSSVCILSSMELLARAIFFIMFSMLDSFSEAAVLIAIEANVLVLPLSPLIAVSIWGKQSLQNHMIRFFC